MSADLIWIVTMAALGVAAVVVQVLFYRRLRSEHRETWRELGEPSFVAGSSMKSQLTMIRFFWGGQHRSLDDDRLRALIYGLRVISIVFGTVLVLGAVFLELDGILERVFVELFA